MPLYRRRTNKILLMLEFAQLSLLTGGKRTRNITTYQNIQDYIWRDAYPLMTNYRNALTPTHTPTTKDGPPDGRAKWRKTRFRNTPAQRAADGRAHCPKRGTKLTGFGGVGVFADADATQREPHSGSLSHSFAAATVGSDREGRYGEGGLEGLAWSSPTSQRSRTAASQTRHRPAGAARDV